MDVMLIPETSGRKDTNDHSRPEAHILGILSFLTKIDLCCFEFNDEMKPISSANLLVLS